MRILVVNAGSSSLKLRVVGDGDALQGARDLDAPHGIAQHAEVEDALRELGAVDAVGHRIVHGGPRHAPVRLDAAVIRELEALTALAPLHQPQALAALRQVGEVLGDVPEVACFDTGFHADMPAGAATYALPAAWRERYGLRRYGFHGLSHAWASRRAAELLGRPVQNLKIVTAHLGAGASLAAVEGGRSVDTTMGFTPLEGLVMATRSGSVDPGLVLWLLERERMDVQELGDALEHASGLLGLAGTADLREVIERDDDDARLALEVYVHRLRTAIGAMAAAMNGLDALVFTGGVGERAPRIRAEAVDGLSHLGLAIDAVVNETPDGDTDLSTAGAGARTLVVAAREDLQIAREVREVLDR